MKPPEIIQELADSVGGTITECQRLPDDSGFAVMSMPLPKDHWSIKDPDGYNVPPMPLRMGAQETCLTFRGKSISRHELEQMIRDAGKYAIRASTMNGKEPDYDPDAVLCNLVVGLLGYHTDDGLSSDSWANPPTEKPQQPT